MSDSPDINLDAHAEAAIAQHLPAFNLVEENEVQSTKDLMFFTQGGLYLQRVTTSKVPHPTEAISSLMGEPVFLAPLMDAGTYFLQQKFHRPGNTPINRTILGKVFNELPFKTHYITSLDENRFVPSFRNSNDAIRDDEFVWKTPEGWDLLFMAVSEQIDNRNFRHSNAYLFLVDSEGPTFYLPPFPNCYGDGRLCTGSIAWTANQGMHRYISTIFDEWSNNYWNSDLLGDNGSSQNVERFVSFDLETREQIPPPSNFVNLLRGATVAFDQSTCIRVSAQKLMQIHYGE